MPRKSGRISTGNGLSGSGLQSILQRIANIVKRWGLITLASFPRMLESHLAYWIPAFAGMTTNHGTAHAKVDHTALKAVRIGGKMKKKIFLIMASGLMALACGNTQAVAQENPAPAADEANNQGEVAKAPSSFDSLPPPGTKAYCTVMETDFEVKEGSEYSVYNGKTYVVCCPGCKTKFDENPEQYANK